MKEPTLRAHASKEAGPLGQSHPKLSKLENKGESHYLEVRKSRTTGWAVPASFDIPTHTSTHTHRPTLTIAHTLLPLSPYFLLLLLFAA